MRVYLQVEYVLDEEDKKGLKSLEITEKEDIIQYVASMIDSSTLDSHLVNLKVIDFSFED